MQQQKLHKISHQIINPLPKRYKKSNILFFEFDYLLLKQKFVLEICCNGTAFFWGRLLSSDKET